METVKKKYKSHKPVFIKPSFDPSHKDTIIRPFVEYTHFLMGIGLAKPSEESNLLLTEVANAKKKLLELIVDKIPSAIHYDKLKVPRVDVVVECSNISVFCHYWDEQDTEIHIHDLTIIFNSCHSLKALKSRAAMLG